MTSAAALPAWARETPAVDVLRALAKAGSEGRLVGGCVRDGLLGRAFKDVDIATPLPPDAVQRALRAAGLGAIPTGIAHGTVTALVRHQPIEVTTLRQDVETDGRHARVVFTEDWGLDAQRRDLTMNALFLDAHGELYDYVGGLEDLKAGRVRFIGDPRRRIEEDYLRLLRFLRFHAHYATGPLDPEGLAAAVDLAPRLAGISGERKAQELLRLLAAPDPLPVLQVMADSGIFRWLLPGLPLPDLSVVAGLGDPDPLLRLAALLPPDPEAARSAAQALRLSKRQAGVLADLAKKRDLSTQGARRRLLYRKGPALLADLAQLAQARGELAATEARAARAEAEAWQPRDFPIGGKDLAALGLPAGPEIGQLLASLEDWWIEQDFAPDRGALLAEAQRRLG